MPLTIVFDTNYLRSFGCSDFISGRLPPRLNSQVNAAVKRGDLILLPETVRIETNAWLDDENKKRHQALINAARTLQDSGFNISPDLPPNHNSVDILDILKSSTIHCDLITPDITDYREAERRTSYRLAPHPKSPDGEEMRDRLIWCQLLKYSALTDNHVVIASNDHLFKNGALTEEGKAARITVASSPEDLDQRLGERPSHIKALIDNLLVFSKLLHAHNIDISEHTIEGVENLRNSRTPEGTLEQRFELLIKDLANPIQGVMSLLGGKPMLLSLENNKIVVEAPRAEASDFDLFQTLIRERPDAALSELRHIIGD